jgi:hypothetical protein
MPLTVTVLIHVKNLKNHPPNIKNLKNHPPNRPNMKKETEEPSSWNLFYKNHPHGLPKIY